MSVLTYGNQVFGAAGWETLGFDMEAVYDPSNTDVECVRFTLQGQCLISEPLNPSDAGDEPATTLPKFRILSRFMKPRQSLSFTVNNVELIPRPPSGTTLDCRNGPLPQFINVIQITEKTFLVNLKIVAHYAESSALTERGLILSHRYRETCDIDLNHLTRKTRSGRIVVSSSNSKKNPTDTVFESIAWLGVEPGFVRDRWSRTLSENGLEETYECVDQERFRCPPVPASDSEGEYSTSTQWIGSIGRFAACRVRLTGPKEDASNQAILVRLATQICWNKLRLNGGFFPIKADFQESLYRNEVSVTLTGRINPGQNPNLKKFMSLAASMSGFGFPPEGSGPGKPVLPPKSRGTAKLWMHAAPYHQADLVQSIDKKTNTLSVAGGTAPVGEIAGG